MENKKETKLYDLKIGSSIDKLLFNSKKPNTTPNTVKIDDKLIPDHLKKAFVKSEKVKDIKIDNQPSLSDRIIALECAVAELALKDIKE
jgi:hypothetical protein